MQLGRPPWPPTAPAPTRNSLRLPMALRRVRGAPTAPDGTGLVRTAVA